VVVVAGIGSQDSQDESKDAPDDWDACHERIEGVGCRLDDLVCHQHRQRVKVGVEAINTGALCRAIYGNDTIGRQTNAPKWVAGEGRDKNGPKKMVGPETVARVVEDVVDLASLGQQDDVNVIVVAGVRHSCSGNLHLGGPPKMDSQ